MADVNTKPVFNPPTVEDFRKASLLVDRARWWLMQEQPFYGALAANLADDFDGSPTWRGRKPTAATNGKRIIWSVRFVLDELDDEELRFVLAHETMHCAHGHLWRLPMNGLGNNAGDYAINLALSKVAGLKMPKIGLLDKRFEGMAEEEIYRILKDEQQNGGGQGGGDPGGLPGGDPSDNNGIDDPGGCGGFEAPDETVPDDQKGEDGKPDPLKSDPLRDRWERVVIQAQILAQTVEGIGDLPSDLKQQLRRVKATEIDWRRETVDFMKDVISVRNDWSRSSRRHAHLKQITPRKRTDQVGTIVFLRDSSASCIDNTMQSEFKACIDTALVETGCSAIVIDIDTRIQAEVRLEPGEQCPDIVQGGGGTNFCPAFVRLKEIMDDEGIRLSGCVYLTDGDGQEPSFEESLELPTLWIVYEGGMRYGAQRPMLTGRTLFVKAANRMASAYAA